MNSLLMERLENNHQLNVDCLTNVYVLVCGDRKKDYSYFIFRLDDNNI